MTDMKRRLDQAVAAIRARFATAAPRVALVLGSGLGEFAESLGDAEAIDYADLPHFPVATVPGHAGRLWFGTVEGVPCAALQGRVHYYEGHDAATVAFPLRVLIAWGAKTAIVTNAAGGLRPAWPTGTLMLLSDHINLIPDNPLRGENDDRIGPRFPDLGAAYDPALRARALAIARRLEISAVEGVYAAVPGPCYETPAEIRMLATLGADAVGMSTTPEVIAAVHMGARVAGISCLTNHASGLHPGSLSHAEVTRNAAAAGSRLQALLVALVTELGAEEGR